MPHLMRKICMVDCRLKLLSLTSRLRIAACTGTKREALKKGRATRATHRLLLVRSFCLVLLVLIDCAHFDLSATDDNIAHGLQANTVILQASQDKELKMSTA
jgi:hypothetical protein